ncbi:MAG: AraC family transcriptional regulator [Acidobacteriaceae bacterium]|nr:AraC family transcriptional regulator [Acidobacteriaceae bacterium]
MDEDMLDRWRRRFERAAALLSGRLDDPPSLAELASAAAVSPFHFHRIWRALTHETVGQTILRLRMEASQELLLVKDASVTETATSLGFGTPQSFARAFRRHTGITPSEHRNLQPPVAEKDTRDMKVAVDWRGEIVVVGLRREGKPYTNLNSTFGQVWSWAEATDTMKDLQGIYGIPLDDPASVPENELRYDACLALGITSAPEPFRVLRLPAGEYASLRHFGSYDGLEAATQRFMGEWLLSAGREPADFPIFHHFHNDPDQTPVDKLITDILLPLRERPS